MWSGPEIAERKRMRNEGKIMFDREGFDINLKNKIRNVMSQIKKD